MVTSFYHFFFNFVIVSWNTLDMFELSIQMTFWVETWVKFYIQMFFSSVFSGG